MTAVERAAERSVQDLREIAWELSRQIIEMTSEAGSGHPSSSLSAIDVMVALYFGGILRYDATRPDWPDRDRFILSKGHAAPGLYAVLARAGYFDPHLLPTLRKLGSPLEGHPNMRALAGVEASTGSLGQGLSIGLGHALAGRLDGRSFSVYVMVGDGEVDEGQVWEAAMAAAKYGLGTLTCILDHNGYQQTGAVEDVMPSLEPLADKWRAFGWRTREIDGHDLPAILAALRETQAAGDRPHLIIAHTLKGKGLGPFERSAANRLHGEALKPAERDEALAQLDRMYGHA